MDKKQTGKIIEAGKTVLGIELGSTRIKAVLVDAAHNPIASGSYEWENQYEDHFWTYSLESVWKGLMESYARMAADVQEKYQVRVTRVGAMGFSAMMHGYMAFDKEGELLVPFRTWRNNTTGPAAEKLTELFQYNIPERWSIAHLYQAILNEEAHVKEVDYITTLAGYIHWKLTGKKVLGVGDASGMFPIDARTKSFDESMLRQFDELVAEREYPWKLKDILPAVLTAGESAGVLTEDGAGLLDPLGSLQAGIPLCPPEGDAGTGMAATNSVDVRTGNVSAGTSIFAMIVLEKDLKKVHREIDLVTTPNGSPVAMVHANNCTSDLNAWVGIFGEFAKELGMTLDADTLYGSLYKKALEGDADGGGLLAYGFLSGEYIVGLEEGRPLFVRNVDSRFNLANFMRVNLYTSMGAIKVGMDILEKEEKIQVDRIFGHGGLFKTPGVGQRFMAAAMDTPVTVLETAGEGGAWGIALLAAYMKNRESGESLGEYLANRVFAKSEGSIMKPIPADVAGFEAFMERYMAGLQVEKAAVQSI